MSFSANTSESFFTNPAGAIGSGRPQQTGAGATASGDSQASRNVASTDDGQGMDTDQQSQATTGDDQQRRMDRNAQMQRDLQAQGQMQVQRIYINDKNVMILDEFNE